MPSAIFTGNDVSFLVTYTGADTINLTNALIQLNITGVVTTGSIVITSPNTNTRLVTITSIGGTGGTLGITVLAGSASNSSGSAPAAGPSSVATISLPIPAPSGYAIAFADDPIQNPNTTLNLTGGNGAATNYSYAIITVPTSGSPVTGSGTVTGTPQSIPINVTSLANGTLQVNFTVSNSAGGQGITDQTTKSV